MNQNDAFELARSLLRPTAALGYLVTRGPAWPPMGQCGEYKRAVGRVMGNAYCLLQPIWDEHPNLDLGSRSHTDPLRLQDLPQALPVFDCRRIGAAALIVRPFRHMKFQCLCGKIISDNTDDLPYKARMIADEDWNRFTESCERPQGYDWRLVTEIYQCPDCGCLRIEKPSGQVSFFKPESEHASKSVLRSVGELT